MSWLDKFFKAYSAVQVAGVAVAPETTINFVGAAVVDDPANNRTTVTVTGGAGTPGGTNGQFQINNAGAFGGVAGNVPGGPLVAPAALVVGDVYYAASTSALAKLAAGTNGQVLTMVGGLPAWAAGSSFDPGSLALTGYWKDYGGAPWLGSSSVGGPSSGRSLAAGVAPTVGASFGAHPSASFNGTTQSLTSATLALDSFFTTKTLIGAPSVTFAAAGNTATRASGSFISDGFQIGDIVAISGTVSNNTNGRAIAAVSATVLTFASGIVNETIAGPGIVVSTYFVQVDFQATSGAAPGAQGYNDAPLFCDNQGNFYLVFTSSGVRAGHYDGTFKVTSSIACSTGVKHCAQMWFDGSTISVRVDGGSAVTTAAGSMSGQTACLPKIGANFNGSTFFAGLEGRIIVANSPLTPTIRDQLHADSQANYGTL